MRALIAMAAAVALAGCVSQYKNRQSAELTIPPDVAKNLQALYVIQIIYDGGAQTPTTIKTITPSTDIQGVPGL